MEVRIIRTPYEILDTTFRIAPSYTQYVLSALSSSVWVLYLCWIRSINEEKVMTEMEKSEASPKRMRLLTHLIISFPSHIFLLFFLYLPFHTLYSFSFFRNMNICGLVGIILANCTTKLEHWSYYEPSQQAQGQGFQPSWHSAIAINSIQL